MKLGDLRADLSATCRAIFSEPLAPFFRQKPWEWRVSQPFVSGFQSGASYMASVCDICNHGGRTHWFSWVWEGTRLRPFGVVDSSLIHAFPEVRLYFQQMLGSSVGPSDLRGARRPQVRPFQTGNSKWLDWSQTAIILLLLFKRKIVWNPNFLTGVSLATAHALPGQVWNNKDFETFFEGHYEEWDYDAKLLGSGRLAPLALHIT